MTNILGPNGFSCEFFKATWDCVGPNLLRVDKVVWKRSLEHLINRGFIQSIPGYP